MTLGHRVGAVCLALAAAALISGCGNSTSSPQSSGSTSSTTTTLPANCSNPSNAFGSVCWVDGTGGTVGINTSPGEGDPISKGNSITTMPSSDIGFWISVKIKLCDTLSNNKLKVWPSGTTPQAILKVLAGGVVCSTLHHPGPAVYLVSFHAIIKMADPVFIVLADPSGAVTIQVIVGTLYVSSDTGQGPVTVTGPEQLTVSASGIISAPVKFVLTRQPKQEQAAIQRVER